jgi:hypothetical protein
MKPSIFLLLLALNASSALAHEISRAKDGNIGGLLHIEPDDAPMVGKANAFYFEVNQKGGKPILMSQCACTLSVYAGNLRAGAKPLSTPKLSQAKGELQGSLNFAAPGAYTLVLAGTPKPGAAFKAFKLIWTVQVGTGTGGGMKH